MEELSPPSEPGASPRRLVTELGQRVGQEQAAGWCGELLSGADPHDYVSMLDYLGSNCRTAAFDPRWQNYWPRTWGARGLLYVWSPALTSTVVAGLGDEHWRPAEMCLKVARAREIGAAGPGALLLTKAGLPRVRAAALRALGAVGDTEHVEVVESALADVDASVRRAADRALTALVYRLDLDTDRVQSSPR